METKKKKAEAEQELKPETVEQTVEQIEPEQPETVETEPEQPEPDEQEEPEKVETEPEQPEPDEQEESEKVEVVAIVTFRDAFNGTFYAPGDELMFDVERAKGLVKRNIVKYKTPV